MDDERIEHVPEGAPMTFDYPMPIFYVRACYPVYYRQIQELFENEGMKYISVTGTPGIGKSMFYLYVINRYREEYPDKTIVTAAFTEERNLMECVVFFPDGRVEPCLDMRGNYHIPTFYKVPDAIHLYDGPPKVQPPRSRMITFTSPNPEWLGNIHKSELHCKLYMHVWTFEELIVASELLDLNIDMGVLKHRFGIFGGIARYCLARTQRKVENGIEKLQNALDTIHSFSDLKACIESRKDWREICHRLFHYVPKKFKDTGYCFFVLMIFGSKWLATKVEKSIRETEKVTRSSLMRMLDGVGKGGTLYGWLFEQYVHETFQSGGEYTLVSLENDEKHLLKIGQYKRLSDEKILEDVFQDTYMIPSENNFESLDSFYYSESNNTLYAFQITKSTVHDVKANGLVRLLELTGLMDSVRKGDVQMVLVFVIPFGLGEMFKKQRIIFDHIPTVEELEDYPLKQIKGIGSAKRYKRLRDESGIHSGRDLYDAVKRKAKEIAFVQSIGSEFVKNVEFRQSWSFLDSIPQFCIEFALDQ